MQIFLHSALVHTRTSGTSPSARATAARWFSADTVAALGGALVVNALILITAGAAFHSRGQSNVGDITRAYELLAPALGSAAPTLFAVALWASGQNSTLTGTLAGQVVCEGFLSWRVRPVLRRLVTRLLAIMPVLAVVLSLGDSGVSRALVASQVVLSFQLPFTLVPLMFFTSSSKRMGPDLVNGWASHVCGWLLVIIIICLNAFLLVSVIGSGDLLAR